jgi:uncharacterized protein
MLSMYALTVPPFTQMLNNLLRILDKAEANAAERKIPAEVLVSARLAPDMYPLSFQIQSATDRTKFTLARLSGRTAPSWADDEKTFDELRARIRKALDYIAEFQPADVDGTEDKPLTLKVRGEEVTVPAQEHLLLNALPQFYFHVTTAYAILRHNGVPIGKRDYTG